jgi:hypothetical protein
MEGHDWIMRYRISLEFSQNSEQLKCHNPSLPKKHWCLVTTSALTHVHPDFEFVSKSVLVDKIGSTGRIIGFAVGE